VTLRLVCPACAAPRDEDDRAIVEAALALLVEGRAHRDVVAVCEALGALDEVVEVYGASVHVDAPSLLALVPLVANIDEIEVADATVRIMRHEAELELLAEHEIALIDRTIARYTLVERGIALLGGENTDLTSALLAHRDRNLR
jgi:hypothetical protein